MGHLALFIIIIISYRVISLVNENSLWFARQMALLIYFLLIFLSKGINCNSSYVLCTHRVLPCVDFVNKLNYKSYEIFEICSKMVAWITRSDFANFVVFYTVMQIFFSLSILFSMDKLVFNINLIFDRKIIVLAFMYNLNT